MKDEPMIEVVDYVPSDTASSTPGTKMASRILTSFLNTPIDSCRVKIANTEFAPKQIYGFLRSANRRKAFEGKVIVHKSNEDVYLIKTKNK